MPNSPGTSTERLVEAGLLTDPASARGRLLSAAVSLFKSQGYERTTVRDLARAVGIRSGSIFHHFRTKEEILAAAMEETILVATEALRAAAQGADGPRDRLRALIRSELESINGESSEAMALLFSEWRSLGESNQARLLGLRRAYEGLWLEALADARRAGLTECDPALLRRLLMGASSWTFTWYDPQGPLDLDALSDSMLKLALNS